MALKGIYLADKSALARSALEPVALRLAPLMLSGRVATCTMIDLEVLYSSRKLGDYEQVADERRGLERIPITQEVMDRAALLQHRLAGRGQHRLAIPDLIISAAAKEAGLIVLHYDSDFEVLEAVGGAPQEWIVTRGSI